jgi:hypothetical protein
MVGSGGNRGRRHGTPQSKKAGAFPGISASLAKSEEMAELEGEAERQLELPREVRLRCDLSEGCVAVGYVWAVEQRRV